jgi:prophage antirepressor-like protein
MTKLLEFKNANLQCTLTYLTDSKGEPWFRGRDAALALGYVDTDQSIRKFVNGEDKMKLKEVWGAVDLTGLSNNAQNMLCLNESGLYSLIMRSKMKAALKFQKWVTTDVLPSIRKTGKYELLHQPVKAQFTFKIENEFDLHTKVVNFINTQYPEALTVAPMGELQDTASKRINAKRLGYQKGAPDIIINNLHKKYVGFCIELKTPKGTGVISEAQQKVLQNYKDNNFKVLISNNYDECIMQLIDYFKDVRIGCQHCSRRFLNKQTLKGHHTGFHRIDL